MVWDTNATVIEQMQSLSPNVFIRRIAILTHTQNFAQRLLKFSLTLLGFFAKWDRL